MEVPTSCLVCYNPIIAGQSVLLHCECVIAICQTCALAQITAQHHTYLRGLSCPSCRLVSDNIHGIEKCQIEERKLIQSAAKFFFFFRNKNKGETSERQLLKRAIQKGYHSSITLEELDSEQVNLSVPIEASMIRLELARLESRRLAKLNPSQNGDGTLGPLIHLRITKNIFLEAAIELTQKLNGTPSDDRITAGEETNVEITYSQTVNFQDDLDSFVINNEQQSEDVSERSNPKQVCVCGDEEGGLYVQCINGTGGCNGWVHPECIPALKGMSREALDLLQDYICPLCEHKVENQKKVKLPTPTLVFSSSTWQIAEGSRVHVTSGKFRGCVATVLSKHIGTQIKVKFTSDSPLPGSVMSLHIKKLEAEEFVENERDSANVESSDQRVVDEYRQEPHSSRSPSPFSRVNEIGSFARDFSEFHGPLDQHRSSLQQPVSRTANVDSSSDQRVVHEFRQEPHSSSPSSFSRVNEIGSFARDFSEFQGALDQHRSSLQQPVSGMFCNCDNSGSGKFIECRSEEHCKGSRFFHMSCVGFVDSPNPKKQKSFFCQECIKNPCDSSRYSEGSHMLNSEGVPYSRASNRHRSSMYSLLYQRQPQHQSYMHGLDAPRYLLQPSNATTTITPHSHSPPLFLPPCPKIPVKSFFTLTSAVGNTSTPQLISSEILSLSTLSPKTTR